MFVESLGGDLRGKLLGLLPVWAVHLVDLLYAMFVLINLMGSLFLFTAYTEGLDRHTWLDDVGKISPTSCDATFGTRACRCMMTPVADDMQRMYMQEGLICAHAQLWTSTWLLFTLP